MSGADRSGLPPCVACLEEELFLKPVGDLHDEFRPAVELDRNAGAGAVVVADADPSRVGANTKAKRLRLLKIMQHRINGRHYLRRKHPARIFAPVRHGRRVAMGERAPYSSRVSVREPGSAPHRSKQQSA